MAPGTRCPGWTGEARSAADGYRDRRADLEPLARLVIDVLALAAVLRRLFRDGSPSRLSEEEAP
ncbi:MAG TPA: hypothetical protein DHU96_27120 [Actinobacteria bacterium]|nr:hypothetical protein [Actinomycetota bacterium]